MPARPSIAILTISQRLRLTLWLQASLSVPVSTSLATSGAPQNAPISAGPR